MKNKNLLLIIIFSLTSVLSRAQNQPQLRLQDFTEGLIAPTDIANCGDDRLFVTEKPGMVAILDHEGNISSSPFLDISSEVYAAGDEQGLLGIAFHPNFAVTGYFFVDYTDANNDVHISRFSVNANDSTHADANSEVSVLVINHPFDNHNGGCIKFGPDGYLYIGVGDGGSEGDPLHSGQDPQSLLGKILRIDVDHLPYSIPADNPFVNTTGYMPEIWALGVRNPWRFSFDRLTGDLWIGEVGQDRREEVDFQEASSTGGENYGWSCYEGNRKFRDCPSNDFVFPVAEYTHKNVPCAAVVGGFVYRGSHFPKLYGKYIYTDFCSGIFRVIHSVNGTMHNTELFQGEPFQYVTFGEDVNRELYVADIDEGEVYRVVDSSDMRIAASATAFQEVSIYPQPATDQFMAKWFATGDQECLVQFVNLMGQTVKAESRTAVDGLNTWSFSTSDLSAGNYLMIIHTQDGLIRTKMIVQ